jgi:hypothetical protein
MFRGEPRTEWTLSGLVLEDAKRAMVATFVRLAVRLLLLTGAVIVAYLLIGLFDRPAQAGVAGVLPDPDSLRPVTTTRAVTTASTRVISAASAVPAAGSHIVRSAAPVVDRVAKLPLATVPRAVRTVPRAIRVVTGPGRLTHRPPATRPPAVDPLPRSPVAVRRDLGPPPVVAASVRAHPHSPPGPPGPPRRAAESLQAPEVSRPSGIGHARPASPATPTPRPAGSPFDATPAHPRSAGDHGPMSAVIAVTWQSDRGHGDAFRPLSSDGLGRPVQRGRRPG